MLDVTFLALEAVAVFLVADFAEVGFAEAGAARRVEVVVEGAALVVMVFLTGA